MAQLRSDLWCSAFVRRQNDLGHFCVVSRRGDPIAGQIWIEVDHLNGTASLFTPAPSLARPDDDGVEPVFQCRFDHVDPERIQERVATELRVDPDLWLLSVASRANDFGLEVVLA